MPGHILSGILSDPGLAVLLALGLVVLLMLALGVDLNEEEEQDEACASLL